MPVNHPILMEAQRMYESLVEWRRMFHQHPELSFQEFGTSQFVSEVLMNIEGMKVSTGIGTETSVIGVLSSGDGPVIAIRADMDALPIKEENDVNYASKTEGVMHACGHDAHTAILLGVAHILGDAFEKGAIKGTIKFVFQPAEESMDENGLSGSPYLVEAGVYDNVDAAIALHVSPWIPVGTFQLHDGYSMANVDVFKGRIFGTGGHGAYPEVGTDPIWMMGPVLQALYGLVSRKVSALEGAVLSIGQVHAGTASNIIPTEVEIEGTVRSFLPDVREQILSDLESVFSIVEQFGGEYSFELEQGEPALDNDAHVNQAISETISQIIPDSKIINKSFGLGGEDFGYVTKKVPGSLFMLGCAIPDSEQRDLHTPIFDIDERCLPLGVAILTETACKLLKRS